MMLCALKHIDECIQKKIRQSASRNNNNHNSNYNNKYDRVKPEFLLIKTLLVITVFSILSSNALALDPSIIVGSLTASPGTEISVPISFSPGDIPASAILFNLEYPSSFNYVSASTGEAAASAGKSVSASDHGSYATVLIAGFNQNAINQGDIAHIRLAISPGTGPGSYNLILSQVSVSDPTGSIDIPTQINNGIITIGSSDTTPPSRSNPNPQGSLPQGTASIALSLETDEPATCKHSQSPGTGYDSMQDQFTNTGGRAHTTIVSTPRTGIYRYYVRCQDTAGNANNNDFEILFSIPELQDIISPQVAFTSPSPGSTLSGSVTISASATDNVGVVGVQFLIDGSLLGSEDTSSPYSAIWDTTQASFGQHTITARARDAAGNSNQAILTVTVDNRDVAAPIILSSAPQGILPFGTTHTTLSLSTDEAAVCRYSQSAGSQFLGMNLFSSTGSMQHSTVVQSLANGNSYAFYVKCQDNSGNTNNQDHLIQFSIAGDAVPPSVAITSPADGSTVTGPVTITAMASDNIAVAGVRFLLDGMLLASEDTISPYSLSWNTNTASYGSHILSAIARDSAGNTNQAIITVIVDNRDTTPPSQPAVFQALSTGTSTIRLTWIASQDDVGVAGYRITRNGAAIGTALGSSTSFEDTGLQPGTTYSYMIIAFDAAGNNAIPATSSATTQIPQDTTPPSRSNPQPTGMLPEGTNQATISLQTDEPAICKYGTASSSFANLPNTFAATGTTSHSSVIPTIAGTAYEFFIRCQDAAGNANQNDLVVSFSIAQHQDLLAPTVRITNPSNGERVNSTILITASAFDDVSVAGVQFIIDGINLGVEDTISPYLQSWDTTTASFGIHSISARARDASGNINMTEITVTVDNTDRIPPSQVTGFVAVAANESAINLSWDEGTDNIAIAGYRLMRGNIVIANLAAAVRRYQDLGLMPGTAYNYTIIAYDSAGNNATPATIAGTTLPHHAEEDSVAPAIVIISPAAGSIVSGMLEIAASASDDYGVIDVRFFLDNSLIFTDNAYPYSTSWNSSALQNGIHNITAIARDAANNINSTAIMINITNHIANMTNVTINSTVNNSNNGTSNNTNGTDLPGTILTITAFHITPSTNNALVVWQTDNYSNATFTTWLPLTTRSLTAFSLNKTLEIVNLTASTDYNYTLISCTAGGVCVNRTGSFSTLAPPAPSPPPSPQPSGGSSGGGGGFRIPYISTSSIAKKTNIIANKTASPTDFHINTPIPIPASSTISGSGKTEASSYEEASDQNHVPVFYGSPAHTGNAITGMSVADHQIFAKLASYLPELSTAEMGFGMLLMATIIILLILDAKTKRKLKESR